MSSKRKVKHKAKRPAGASARSHPVPTELLLATGAKAQRTGDVAGAEDAFRKVLASDPDNIQAIQFLGALLSDRNEVDEALELFERVEKTVDPPSNETFAFWNNYANVLRRATRPLAAQKILVQLVEVAPREWQAWHNLGQTYKDLEAYDEAAAALRRAVMIEPEFGPNHGVLGEVLHHLGRLHSADSSLRRCIDLGWSNDHGIWTMLANNQRLLGDLENALASAQRALALSGGAHAAQSNAGVVLMTIGRFDEAIEHYHRAIEQEPENNTYQGYLSYALLGAGRVTEAMDSWERGKIDGPRGTMRDTDVPTLGPDDSDVRVLVYREQGVGDEIMLASMYPDVIDATREVVIECDSRLVQLFTRSFPAAEVREQTHTLQGETMHDYDRALPAGNLMRRFRPTLDAFPRRDGFLVPDPEKVAAWQERLAQAGPPPYVGFSWRSKVRTAERRLEYTRLEEWGDIFAAPGVTWINLQYDKCEPELHDAEQRFGVKIHKWAWLDLMNDFDEVAALNASLDLVVAPFNAAAMLSGALGVRTVTMGNRHGWSEMGTGTVPFLPSLVLALRMPNEPWDDVLAFAARETNEVAARTATSV